VVPRYGDWVVLVTRLMSVARGFIALPAGVARMPFWRFLLCSTIGSAVWCTVLAIVGRVLGQHWNSVSGNLRNYDVTIIVVVIALIAFAVYRRLQGERRDRNEPATSAD